MTSHSNLTMVKQCLGFLFRFQRVVLSKAFITCFAKSLCPRALDTSDLF